jgi:hypothetical protein
MLEDRGASRHQLVSAVLDELLDWAAHGRTDLPDALGEVLPEQGTVLRPDFGFYVEPDVAGDEAPEELDEGEEEPDGEEDAPDDRGIADATGPWRVLGMISPWGAHPLARATAGGWTASPVERLAHLLRSRRVPIGLVTDGRWWTLVWAPVGGTVASATWDAEAWSEEPETLAALSALVGRHRFLAAEPRDTLPALFLESLDRQEEITESLGRQVLEAVELSVSTLDTLDAESGRALLSGVSDDNLYDGVVTFLMRLVFLLFAEERRLLPSDEAAYVEAYSVGRLVEQLEERAALSGEAILEHRTSAWHRLLAVSRAIHQGVAHEDLRLPAYGGGLFDPDRYPWLEGRGVSEGPDAVPPRVDDRTVLRMLRAVQFVEVGGERRRLTFRSLDVEQIGYVYEGLLEREVRTANDVVLLLLPPPRGKKPKMPAEVSVREWAKVAWANNQARWCGPRLGLSVRAIGGSAARLWQRRRSGRSGESASRCFASTP